MTQVRRVLAYPFVAMYFVLSLVLVLPHLLLVLVTRTVALIQTGDVKDAFMPVWMMAILTKLMAVTYVVKTRTEPTIVIHNVYCEAQGPGARAGEDHLEKEPPRFSTKTVSEFGEPDEHGGRRLSVGGKSIGCPTCGAMLRRFEVKS